MKVLQALVEYVVRSGAFILPEDPSRPGEHDWKATPITKMESTVQYGKHVIRKEFPEKIQAWGQEIPKAECALVYGTAVSYSGEAPNKRAYLVRAMLSSQGVVAVPLAMFVLGPNGWFLSSQTAPPRLGVETASTQRAANIANGIRPLDGRSLGIILSWLTANVTNENAAYADAASDAIPIRLDEDEEI